MVESKQKPFPPVHRASSSSSSKNSEGWNDMERINVQSIKDHIAKRVGIEKAKRYFSHFRRFLSLGLSKPKLDKLVVKTIGKENVSLHNQLVRAILSNAVKGKVSPIQSVQSAPSKPPLIPNSPCVTSEDTIHYASPSTLISNGDSFLPSPRRGRTLRDHKASPLGPREDHFHSTPDLFRSTQQLDGVKPDDELNRSLQPSTKRAKISSSGITELTILSGESSGLLIEGKDDANLSGENDSLLKERREEAISCGENGGLLKERGDDAMSLSFPFRSPLHALQSTHHKVLPQALPRILQEAFEEDSIDARKLPDGDSMHMYMEQMTESEGLEGVSRDSADILNLALDAYLTRLIRSYTNLKIHIQVLHQINVVKKVVLKLIIKV